MGTYVSALTVLFEEPFWIGLYERSDGGRYEVCKITFGTETKEYEVNGFLLQNWSRLRFSQPIESAAIEERRVNPKRMQRQVSRELPSGIGTKAQQALKLQQADGRQARQTRSREQREADAKRQFDLRQEKHKQKHKGH